MFPIRINVLSESKKVYLRRLTLFSYLKNSCAIIFVVICFFSILLIFIDLFFREYRTALRDYGITKNQTYQSNISNIQKLNKELTTISLVQESYHLITPDLHNIFLLIPEGIVVQNLSINIQEKSFTMNVFAEDQQKIGEFFNFLKSNPEISDVQSLNPPQSTPPDLISYPPFSIKASFDF